MVRELAEQGVGKPKESQKSAIDNYMRHFPFLCHVSSALMIATLHKHADDTNPRYKPESVVTFNGYINEAYITLE